MLTFIWQVRASSANGRTGFKWNPFFIKWMYGCAHFMVISNQYCIDKVDILRMKIFECFYKYCFFASCDIRVFRISPRMIKIKALRIWAVNFLWAEIIKISSLIPMKNRMIRVDKIYLNSGNGLFDMLNKVARVIPIKLKPPI